MRWKDTLSTDKLDEVLHCTDETGLIEVKRRPGIDIGRKVFPRLLSPLVTDGAHPESMPLLVESELTI